MYDNELSDDFGKVLNTLEQKILTEINCVSIGRVESVNYAEQTVETSIVYKRVLASGEIKGYPLLLDVPFMILQGGGSYIGLPVATGDYCLVLFCDRNFSIWWDSGAEKEPESQRKHNLSDGIAIVGINPKSRPLGYSGENVSWNFGHDMEIKVKEKITIANSSTDILTLLKGLIDVIKGLSTYGSPTAQVLDVASKQALEQYKTTLETLLKGAE
ncbi:MAG: hypothetical protein LBQ83_03045 [Candidatus Margulisbacteria bacterium]|jgi:hypothetical protein|nr:hypothetical protein [Candidatus Margulisiibacteriota bacterium]